MTRSHPRMHRGQQRRQRYTFPFDCCSGASGCRSSVASALGSSAIDEAGGEADQRIQHEHYLDRMCRRHAAQFGDGRPSAAASRSGGCKQGSDEAVARERGRALPVGDDACEHGMLQDKMLRRGIERSHQRARAAAARNQ